MARVQKAAPVKQKPKVNEASSSDIFVEVLLRWEEVRPSLEKLGYFHHSSAAVLRRLNDGLSCLYIKLSDDWTEKENYPEEFVFSPQSQTLKDTYEEFVEWCADIEKRVEELETKLAKQELVLKKVRSKLNGEEYELLKEARYKL